MHQLWLFSRASKQLLRTMLYVYFSKLTTHMPSHSRHRNRARKKILGYWWSFSWHWVLTSVYYWVTIIVVKAVVVIVISATKIQVLSYDNLSSARTSKWSALKQSHWWENSMGVLGLPRQVQGGHPLICLPCRAAVDANPALEKPLISLSRVHSRCSSSLKGVRHSKLPVTGDEKSCFSSVKLKQQ